MSKIRIFSFISWMFLSLLLVVGCNSTTTVNPPATLNATPGSATLTISAAASLKDAMEQIQPLYTKEKPNAKLTYNFGSSGALQQQIEQGAGVDVFISAASKQMDALEKKGLLLEGTRKDLLKNEVVLVVPQKSTQVTDFKDLTKPSVKKIALGEPKSVPAGEYAQQVLTALKILLELNPKLYTRKMFVKHSVMLSQETR